MSPYEMDAAIEEIDTTLKGFSDKLDQHSAAIDAAMAELGALINRYEAQTKAASSGGNRT